MNRPSFLKAILSAGIFLAAFPPAKGEAPSLPTAETPAAPGQTDSIRELPLPAVPAELRDPAERAAYVIRHFWDGADFALPSAMLEGASLEQNFVNYINLFPHTSPETTDSCVSILMREAEKNPPLARSLYSLAGKYLGEKDSPFRNERFLIPFLRCASTSEAAGEAERERAKFNLGCALKNRPGTPMPDFGFVSRGGKMQSIGNLPSDRMTIVVFYDPDCGHCAEVMEEIKMLPADSAHIAAIDAEEDRELWEATASALPQTWTVGFATDPVQDDETFIFEEMPTLFLLAPDKTILLKNATMEEIRSALR